MTEKTHHTTAEFASKVPFAEWATTLLDRTDLSVACVATEIPGFKCCAD